MPKVPDQITPVTPGQVFDALQVAWQEQFGQVPHRTTVLVLVAQWGLETGRGRSMHCFNLGNVKSNGKSGDWCFFRCNEVLNGKVVWFDPDHEACRFRAFPNLAAGAADYLKTLHQRFAGAWPAVVNGDPAAFSHLLRLQKYYTADEAQYTKTLVALFAEFSRSLGSAAGPAAAGPDFYSVAGVQTALTRLGFDPGPIDGQDGPRTQAAVERFQAAQGLVVDGIVGRLTRAALVNAWATLRATT
jgi:hypothetical protein